MANFGCGNTSPLMIMVTEQEERKHNLDNIVNTIKKNYTSGIIDLDDLAAECGIDNLSPEEIRYIENKINKR